MEHFDAPEVREIEIDDTNYPELLKKIENPPNALRVRGSLPPNTKIIAISGSRKTTKQALDAAYRIGKMLAQHGYTIVDGLAEGCDTAATEGALSADGTVIAEERSGSSATANRALSQGRAVIITRYVAAKIEGATIVKNTGELKDALGIDRKG